MAVHGWPVCLHNQRWIDELEEEVKNLRAKLRYQERRQEDGYFGSSPPSSKPPLKPNTEDKVKKPRGARVGHKGASRIRHDDRPTPLIWPQTAEAFWRRRGAERSVIDTPRQKPEKITFRLAKRYCAHWGRTVTAQAPGVLPKSLYGN